MPKLTRILSRVAKLGRFLVSPSVALLLLWMIVPLGMTLYFSLTPYDPINLPIVVWMVYTYFKDILEAAPWIAHTLAGDGPRSAADCQGRPGLHRVAVADPVLERGILVAEPDFVGRCAVNCADRLQLQPRRLVLGQVVRRVVPGLRADPEFWLDQPETAGARFVLRRSEISPLFINPLVGMGLLAIDVNDNPLSEG
jgi:ABC-type sugar transport system permease subunit